MLPGQDARLAELSQEILLQAGTLSSMLPAEETRQAVAAVIREMNSYYSNLIEGHRTLPRDIGITRDTPIVRSRSDKMRGLPLARLNSGQFTICVSPVVFSNGGDAGFVIRELHNF